MARHFDRFDPDKELWACYLMRCEFHFETHDITEERKKKAALCSWLSPEIFALLQNMLSVEVTAATYDDVKAAIKLHYTKNRNFLAARLDFYNMTQKDGQMIADFLIELRKKAKDCEFEEHCCRKCLDNALRDRLVMVCRHTFIQQAILKETDVSLDAVLRCAKTAELLSEELNKMSGQSTSTQDVHAVRHAQSSHQGQRSSEVRRGSDRRTWHTPRPCSRCGSSAHQPNDCPYLDSICYNCNKKGHISSACRSKDGTSVAKRSNDKRPKTQAKWRGKPFRNVDHATCSTGNGTVDILTTTHLVAKPQISLQIAGTDVTFEVDTGASMSLVGEDVWQNIGSPALKTSNIRLFGYGKKVIPVKGLCDVPVSYDGETQTLPLIVTNKVGKSLFALDWIHAFKLDLNVLVHGEKPAATSIAADCNQVGEDDHALQKAIEQFPAVFAPGLGHCTLVKAHLTLKEDATPKFCKPRPVPFSRLEAVDKELERLEKLDVITHVDHSEWATPVVVVQKSNGSVRLCGDYKVTVNPQLHIDRHPIPRVEELFAKLQGGQHFTKLDMSDAYLQVELDDATKQLLVINTHRGLYRYNRLAFGPAPAPAIFQRLVENLVAGIPYVAAYLDDVIVTGRTKEEHMSNLKQVLSALNEHGMKLRLEKCEFFRKQVTYLGHVISAEGLKPFEKRVDAVVNFPKPENVKQLESFIGKLNYY